MIFARSAAMAFNRFIDRYYDGLNPRTAVREIPAGKISPVAALIFTIITSSLFIFCTYFINKLCFYLSPVALTVILGYSLTKRFTPLCHLVLGLGLSLAPIGAYAAVTNCFDAIPVYFSVLVFLWVSGFDIIYALQDEEFDRENGLNSIPVLMGKKNALHFSEVLHLLCAIVILYLGFQFPFSFLYWIGSFLFTILLIYQHLIVKPNDLSRVNLAFGTTNGIASVIFGVLACIDIVLK
jgi:4-hydroxybenzoate polyprenyltransferase